MRIDYISDLHVNTWIESDSDIAIFVKKIVPTRRNINNILVIAGDMGENIDLSVRIIKELKKYYEYIALVPGNHDFYIFSKADYDKFSGDSFNKLNYYESKISELDNVYFLNGRDVIDIDGISFGGTMGWYDGQYSIRKLGYTQDAIDNLWKHRFIDSWAIFVDGKNEFNWKEYMTNQRDIINSLAGNVDVLVTHYIPIWEHIEEKYSRDVLSGFFHFDGYEQVDKMNGRYWIYGHTHTSYKYEYNHCHLACNPLGYSGEKYIGDWKNTRLLRSCIKSMSID